MENNKVLIRLTDEQKKLVRAATSRDADAIELTIEELEERISPGIRLTNHNETFLRGAAGDAL